MEQVMRRAERAGDSKELANIEKNLSALVKTAQKAEKTRKEYLAYRSSLGKVKLITGDYKASVIPMRDEGSWVRKIPKHLVLSEYQAFLRRVDAGYYKSMQGGSLHEANQLKSLANIWRGAALGAWTKATNVRCVEPRIAVVLQYQEMIPFDHPRHESVTTTVDETRIKYEEDLAKEIKGVYIP